MVAGDVFHMIQINNPFAAGAGWHIQQLFQMMVLVDGVEHFLFGFFDPQKNQFIIQEGRDEHPRYFTVPEFTKLGEILRYGYAGAIGWRFTEAGWAQPGGQPLPAINQTNDLMDLPLADINTPDNAVSFTCECFRVIAA